MSYVTASDCRRGGVQPPLKAVSGLLQGICLNLRRSSGWRSGCWRYRKHGSEDQRRYSGKSGFGVCVLEDFLGWAVFIVSEVGFISERTI